MLVDKQNELMSDLLFTVHQHGGDDVTWKPPILTAKITHAQTTHSLPIEANRKDSFKFQIHFWN